ncbi:MULTISPECIES: LysR family transcriptional regulator [Prauserella salsuginis group]|uniref:DNA-binding transcriptional LysR family regulator n=2 Tax=Prauserella salsuginis group TaxID=2893672 RepID=A0A839XN83_9PSEU|nr:MULTISPECIES: LysR family transcriptional regulator [Prauserella salsuginis group]MBB3664201.1 DNA-binding transcriptional LysR family regulator [Prauserella sediminis]MCR3721650.1 DNA-binding transcriptional regulator, LysR family [Prauserella flava]MCR3734342.1 DNA-binding transcriptional regulator, LysR family [Prauserella salsuginis]
MTELPDIESLQLLVLVGEHRSLTTAAAQVGTTQPAASKRISALERRLGVRLLDRSRTGSTLTPDGRLICSWAERVIENVNLLVEGVNALRRERTAQLSLAASLTVAEHLLPTWIGELRRQVPDLHVGLQVLNSTRVCELVRNGEIDLGFIESPRRLRRLRSQIVARDRLVLVVAPGHRWARRRTPVDAAELAATPLISRESGSGTRDTVEQALLATGLTPVEPLLELGSTTAVRSSVATGAGPALLSELVVASDLAAGNLREVATSGVDLHRTLRAVWHTGAAPSGAAAELLALASRAGAGPRTTSVRRTQSERDRG